MIEYHWLKLDPRGTVSINVSDTLDDDWVELRLAKIRDIRRFGLMVEDADAVVRDAEAKIRVDVGMDQAAIDLINMLHSAQPDGGGIPVELAAQAPDVMKLEADYVGAIQRFLLGPDNPYPAVYAEMLADMGGRHIDQEDLPGFALGQPALAAIIAHFQQAPLVLGMQTPTPPPAPPAPNRKQPQDRQPKRAVRDTPAL